MNIKKKAIEYNINPLWKFLEENYGLEEAFAIFGPYAGASIKPKLIDNFTIEVSMPLVITNTNYVGTHFGGSLYSMCDPFYMFILMRNLGNEYMVWDKSAKIDFLKPGTGVVKAKFHIPNEEIQEIRNLLNTQKKTIRTYQTQVLNEDKAIVAQVTKELYIRKIGSAE